MFGHLLCHHGYDNTYDDVNNLLYIVMAPEPFPLKAQVKA